MSDDILGRNPLEGGLDSIWKIPKKMPDIQKPLVTEKPTSILSPSTQAGEVQSQEQTEEWTPIDDEEHDDTVFGEVSEMFSSHHLLQVDEMEEKEVVEDSLQLVGFRLGSELFGIDIMSVQEIIRVIGITRVPKTAEFVKGVVNLRGKVIPVVDLKNKFSFNAQGFITGNERIIIVNTAVGTVGFMVDAVTEVLSIPERIIAPPLSYSSKLDSKFITGIGKLEEQLLVILDLSQIVLSSQLNADA